MAEQRQNRMPVNKMAGPAGPRPAGAAAALTPREIVAILRRHVLLIVSLTVLGLIIGGVTWYLLRRYSPRYTAQTIIEVLSPIEKDPMVVATPQASRDIQYGHRLSMANLITRQSTLQKLVDRDEIQETEWFKRFGEIRDVSIRKAITQLRKKFRASAQRDGNFIVLSMTCSNAKEAALIVNEMMELFLASQGIATRGGIAERLAKLKEQRNRLQRDLDAAEDALDQTRKKWGLTDLEVRNFRHTITEKLGDLEIQQSNLVMQIKQLQTTIETLKKQATGPIGKQVERQVETDPIMIGLAQRITALEAQLAGKLTKFGENHRVVREIQELIDANRRERQSRRAEIADLTRQANLLSARDTLVALQGRLEELEKLRQETAAKQRELNAARVQYAQRAAIRDERRKMLDSIKRQIESYTIVHDDPETPKVQYAGHAPVPLQISFPKWRLCFAGGMVLGFMCGVGLAFLIELLNDLVRTPRDVSRYLRIPLLGIIPDAAEDEQVQDIDLCHVVRQVPYSIISESYRRLRTNLKLSTATGSYKALLISSGVAGDGKTSVAANLAATFVAEDRKVLLVDANFRRPSMHSAFPKPEAKSEQNEEVKQPDLGLSTLLAGLCGYREIIRPSGIEGLSLIDSGPLPPNPAELLGSERMEQLIKRQRQQYDYVIIDGPPVLLVSDAKVLARFVDGTILVFNAAATRRGAALRTINELRQVNATVAGCVVLAVKALKGGYFQEQFKSYQKYQQLQLAASAV